MNVVSQIHLYLFCLYLLSLHFIVAWYKILDVKCNPFDGQSSLTRQLHNFCGSAGFGCSIFFGVTVYFWSDVGHPRITKLIVFLLKIFTNLRFGGKCLPINLMNIFSILVLTDWLYVGFNQIVLGVLFFLFRLLYSLFLGIFHRKMMTKLGAFF